MSTSLIVAAILVGAGVLGLLGIIFSTFMLHRNRWVFQQRIRLNDACYRDRVARIYAGDHGVADEPYWDKIYLSYDQMLWRFWIWDVEKLRRPIP